VERLASKWKNQSPRQQFTLRVASSEQRDAPADAPGDGHFVTITSIVMMIPEPGTGLHVGLGLIGLGVVGRRSC
jgi:hypothetical protein